MTFRELLEKYKEGTLTEEEKKLVEDELEKNEAINDFLAENLDFSSSFINSGEAKSDVTTNKVRKTVNRKLFKVVALSVIIVFAILFSVKYIVSPLVASKYYNPTKYSLSKYDQDFIFDLRALNELVNPGYGITMSYAEDEGFGKYNLIYDTTNLFTRETFTTNTKIVRNTRPGKHLYYSIKSDAESKGILNPLWENPRDNEAFKVRLSIELDNTKNKINELKNLPSTSYVSAYILSERDLNMYEMQDLIEKYPSIKFNWAAIRVSEDRVITPIGFRISTHGEVLSNDVEYYKKYPALILQDYYFNDPSSQGEDGLVPGYSKHFKTLLKYLSEHMDAVESLSNFDLSVDLKFNEYLNYVENNGVNAYGFLVYTKVNDLLYLYENENVLTIDIDNVLPSIYSTKYNN